LAVYQRALYGDLFSFGGMLFGEFGGFGSSHEGRPMGVLHFFTLGVFVRCVGGDAHAEHFGAVDGCFNFGDQ